MSHWHIITGEYPPQPGGVSDYTSMLAAGLRAAGDSVDVWAPQVAAEPTLVDIDGLAVNRLAGQFGPRGLAELEHALRRRPAGQLLVQYVPHMYGFKAMNLPFCAWLRSCERRDPWVMFHEVAFPMARGQRLKHNLLGFMHRVMAALAARAARRVFVSIPRWEAQLQSLATLREPAVWLPIPSTLPDDVSESAIQRVRGDLGIANSTRVLGHFGTYIGEITQMLDHVLPTLLTSKRNRSVLLLGRGSVPYRAKLAEKHPELSNQLLARADLPAAEVSAHLAACEVLVQPFIDGVSARRTSVMAGLALGKAIVTTAGPATEPIWQVDRLVEMASLGALDDLITQTEQLLADSTRAESLGRRARDGYARNFSLRRTIDTLRS